MSITLSRARRSGRDGVNTPRRASSPTPRFIGVSTAVPRPHALGPGADRLRPEHAAATTGSSRAPPVTLTGTRRTPSPSTRGRTRTPAPRSTRRPLSRSRRTPRERAAPRSRDADRRSTTRRPKRRARATLASRTCLLAAGHALAGGLLPRPDRSRCSRPSLQTRHRRARPGYEPDLAASATTPTRSREYGAQFIRSFVYAGIATAARAADRLPAGLHHRVQVRAVAQPAARAGHRAVLHQLPAPHAGLEDDPRRRRARGRADVLNDCCTSSPHGRPAARRRRSQSSSA